MVTPNATTAAQIQQLPTEQRRGMAKTAAHQLYALLELKKSSSVEVEQKAAYDPIYVTVLWIE